jgi:hypothetical protein
VNPLKGDCTIILRGDGMINLTINAPPLGGRGISMNPRRLNHLPDLL